MSVKIKQNASVKNENDIIITFNADDFKAVKGLKGSFFEGKIKALHKVQAEKLIAAKKAEEVKGVTIEKEDNPNRSVKDIKTN